MAVKVYINTAGNAVIVDDGTSPVNVIRLDSFFYEKDEAKDYVTIRDTDDEYVKRVKSADVTDEVGTPYGTIEDVVDFFNTIYDLSIAQPLPAGAATEAKQDSQIAVMTSILNNMIASLDAEILLVADDGNGGQIVQQIREYDQGTGVWSTRYEDVNGVAYVPVGPLRYLDASAVLNLILTELLDQGLSLDTLVTVLNQVQTNTLNTVNELTTANVTLNDIEGELISLNSTAGTLATQATLELVRLLLVSLDGKDFATENTLNLLAAIRFALGSDGSPHGTGPDGLRAFGSDGAIDRQLRTNTNGELQMGVVSSVLPTGAATEATLSSIDTDTGNIATSTSNIDGSTASIKQNLADVTGTDGSAHGLNQKGVRALGTTSLGNDEQISVSSDGEVFVLVNNELVVTATNLDIRDLTHVSDSVKVGDGTDFMAVNDDGSINVQGVALDATLNSVVTNTASIDSRLTPATRTHNTVSATGVGSVPAGSMCGSVINAGGSAGTWNGISLPAGISIPWTQIGNRDTYGSIAYDATGTTFIIEYTT